MKHVTTGFWFLVCLGHLHLAQAAETTCYERVYDKAHMQKHRLQEIVKMRLSLSGEKPMSGQIAAGFRESPNYRSSDFKCKVGEILTTCNILAEGGNFSFTKTPKGIRLLNTSLMRFGDADNGISIASEKEHRVFLLLAAPVEACAG
jgi:hypothetical protein